jgi:hypothetical protein
MRVSHTGGYLVYNLRGAGVEKQNIIRSVTFAAIFFVFVWWGSSGFPTEYQVCEITNNAEHCGSYNILFGLAWKGVLILDRYGALITALATIAIASFTYTLWRATDRLWKAGEKQIELIGDSSKAALISAKVSERAFKLSHSANFAFRPMRIAITEVKVGKPIKVNMNFHNFRNGTAYGVSCVVEGHVRPKGSKNFRIDFPPINHRTFIGGEDETIHSTTDEFISDEQIKGLRNGELNIYVVATVKFRDDISDEVKTQAICVAYSWNDIKDDKPPKVISQGVVVMKGDEVVALTG